MAAGSRMVRAVRLKTAKIDVDVAAKRGLAYERLDQLLVEHLLGVRG